MRHRLDDVQPMAHGSATSTLREARKVAMTYDERSEPTYINDRRLSSEACLRSRWVLTSHLSREDFVSKKGAMRKMKIYGPNFHIFSSISPCLAYQGDVEKVLVVCFLFLGDPAENSGIGASTKFWHVKSFSLNYVWVVVMVPQT